MSHTQVSIALLAITLVGSTSIAQTSGQPKVTPGPVEPDWVAILDAWYGLSQFADLANPVTTTSEAVPGLFRKAGPGAVRYQPVIALGLETVNRGGWYTPAEQAQPIGRHELWSYQFKNTAHDLESGENLPPPLADGSSVTFDPGETPFGLWVANDGLDDGGVYTEPSQVRAINKRLATQPYKAMIYPYRDKRTGAIVPNSYLIGWEYSTNDDFQDVVCRVDNVVLVAPETP